MAAIGRYLMPGTGPQRRHLKTPCTATVWTSGNRSARHSFARCSVRPRGHRRAACEYPLSCANAFTHPTRQRAPLAWSAAGAGSAARAPGPGSCGTDGAWRAVAAGPS